MKKAVITKFSISSLMLCCLAGCGSSLLDPFGIQLGERGGNVENGRTSGSDSESSSSSTTHNDEQGGKKNEPGGREPEKKPIKILIQPVGKHSFIRSLAFARKTSDYSSTWVVGREGTGSTPAKTFVDLFSIYQTKPPEHDSGKVKRFLCIDPRELTSFVNSGYKGQKEILKNRSSLGIQMSASANFQGTYLLLEDDSFSLRYLLGDCPQGLSEEQGEELLAGREVSIEGAKRIPRKGLTDPWDSNIPLQYEMLASPKGVVVLSAPKDFVMEVE